jgi:hypothetical protein
MISNDETIKYVIPLVEGVLSDKKWRFKFAVAESLVNFFRALSFDEHREFF